MQSTETHLNRPNPDQNQRRREIQFPEKKEIEMRNPTSASTKTSKSTPCCTKVGLKRGPWTPEEDQLLASYIAREGEGRWRVLPSRAGLLRCGKSCRLRWMNYLRPTVKRGQIAPDEEDLILRLHRLLGNRWSLIAGRIPGRTDNEIKNYWNTHLSKKLISQGIDPRTHKPLNPNPSSSSIAHASAPSPSPAPSPAPAPNPNPNSSSSEDKGGDIGGLNGANTIDSNCGIGYFQGPNKMGGLADNNLQNSDGMMMMVMGLQDYMGSGNNNEDVDCSGVDVFSSFLDSLIDEDRFLTEQQPNMGAASDSLVPSALGFNFDWDIAAFPSQEGGNGDECVQLADHVGKSL